MTRSVTLASLLDTRLATDPAGPLVTYYDDTSGERTELSAATFANWVAKTANLLVDGLGLGRGDRAVLALPLHWQSLVVAAGCWAAGLEVVLPGPGPAPGSVPAADVACTAEGGLVVAADELVRLSLRPMGAGLATPDAAVTDYAAEVRTYGDRFPGPGPSAAHPALAGRTHAELAAGPGDARRVLLAPDGDPPLDVALMEAAYLGPLRGGGSVVLCRHADRALLRHRADTERAAID